MRLPVLLGSLASEGRATQEAFEAILRYFGGLLVVDMLLIVVEELVFLPCEGVGFESYFEAMCCERGDTR